MALKKTYLKSKPLCKVTFNFPFDYYPSATSVEVAGTFTDWQPIQMRKIKEGFTRTFDLPVSSEHQFRYRINGEIWENDHEADGYINTGVDLEENSVVSV